MDVNKIELTKEQLERIIRGAYYRGYSDTFNGVCDDLLKLLPGPHIDKITRPLLDNATKRYLNEAPEKIAKYMESVIIAIENDL